MSDTPPDRITTSTTPFRASTPRHVPGPPLPPKRWYLRGNRDFREIFAVLVVGLSVLWCGVFALFFIIGVIPETWRGLGRALVVVAFLALAWCAAFVRRGWFPPKGAAVLGGDDE